MASLSASFKIGTGSATSLLKSAATLSREISAQEDVIQKYNFDNNPSDAQLNTYLTYLSGRVNTLGSSTSIADQTKAIELGQTMKTAVASNTSFNIQNESIQVLTGNATDTQKLDYLRTAYSRATAIGDPKLAQTIESQAYNFQQSAQLHAQQAQTAAIVNFNADQSAIKQGYTNSIDSLDAAWSTITKAYQDGSAGDVQAAIDKFMSTQGPILKSQGIQLPDGAQPTMGALAQAVMNAKLAYYENGAASLNAEPNPSGGPNQDAKAFQQKAEAIYNGVDTIQGPNGQSMNLNEVTKWALEPSNMYSPSTDANGKTTYAQNAVTGYSVVKGQLVPGDVASSKDMVIPQTTGQTTTPYDALSKDQKSGLFDQLKKLGFGPAGTSASENGGWTKNGELTVTIGNDAAKWLTDNGKSNPDLAAGTKVTLIPTNNGTGFQFVSSYGKSYGVSMDNKGMAGLYNQTDTGGWNLVGGQYGFNPSQTTDKMNEQNQQMINRAKTSQAGQPSFGAGNAGTNFGVIASGISDVFNRIQGRPSPAPTMKQRQGGGFNFTNAQGEPISAATYAMITGTPFRTVLGNMATAGDQGASTALQFVGNDYGYDPTKAVSYQNSNVYNSLVWGAKGVNQMPGGAPASALGNGAQLKV